MADKFACMHCGFIFEDPDMEICPKCGTELGKEWDPAELKELIITDLSGANKDELIKTIMDIAKCKREIAKQKIEKLPAVIFSGATPFQADYYMNSLRDTQVVVIAENAREKAIRLKQEADAQKLASQTALEQARLQADETKAKADAELRKKEMETAARTAEAKAKAEAEVAKAQAEAERKKAESEAKKAVEIAKAQADAKAQAEAEAKKAEENAKEQAAAQAQAEAEAVKAQAEAVKAQAEAEAKKAEENAKTEAEAMVKKEIEKHQADLDAKNKAELAALKIKKGFRFLAIICVSILLFGLVSLCVWFYQKHIEKTQQEEIALKKANFEKAILESKIKSDKLEKARADAQKEAEEANRQREAAIKTAAETKIAAEARVKAAEAKAAAEAEARVKAAEAKAAAEIEKQNRIKQIHSTADTETKINTAQVKNEEKAGTTTPSDLKKRPQKNAAMEKDPKLGIEDFNKRRAKWISSLYSWEKCYKAVQYMRTANLNSPNKEMAINAVLSADLQALKEIERNGFQGWNDLDLLCSCAEVPFKEIALFLFSRNPKISESTAGKILISCSQKKNTEVAKLLISQYNVDINRKDKYGSTLLHLNLREVEFLVKLGADVNVKDEEGQTILHKLVCDSCVHVDGEKYAIDWSDTIKFLIARGANLNDVDKKGNTPLHYAAYAYKGQAWYYELELSDHSYKITKILVEHGAKINVKNKDGKTPLDLCGWLSKTSKYLKEKQK